METYVNEISAFSLYRDCIMHRPTDFTQIATSNTVTDDVTN